MASSRLKIAVLSRLAALVIKLLSATLRWRYGNLPKERLPFPYPTPVIFAFWHGRMLMLPSVYNKQIGACGGRKMYVLISEHGDGRIIARAVKSLGIDSVAGSSTRGGKRALREMVTLAQGGANMAITPDGPRGPRYEAKLGAVSLAQLTGHPIYPAAYSCQRRWTLGSWDSMIIPKPFSKSVTVVGDPIYVPRECSEEELEGYRLQLQAALRAVTEEADAYEYP